MGQRISAYAGGSPEGNKHDIVVPSVEVDQKMLGGSDSGSETNGTDNDSRSTSVSTPRRKKKGAYSKKMMKTPQRKRTRTRKHKTPKKKRIALAEAVLRETSTSSTELFGAVSEVQPHGEAYLKERAFREQAKAASFQGKA